MGCDLGEGMLDLLFPNALIPDETLCSNLGPLSRVEALFFPSPLTPWRSAETFPNWCQDFPLSLHLNTIHSLQLGTIKASSCGIGSEFV